MPLTSMTGFGRADGETGNEAGLTRWHWELRSVNGKGLDARFRLPSGFEGLEPRLREEMAKHLKRGNVQATLTIDRVRAAAPLRVNEEAMDAVLAALAALQQRIELMPPRPEGILALKGILETSEGEEGEEDHAALEKLVLASFAEAVISLARARAEEGRRLEGILHEQVDEIERLTRQAAASPSAGIEAMRARLRTQVAELLGASPALSEERLAQEAALLATKADVREEIDRLIAHVAQARELFAGTEPAGRRLDFLTQEFNREANTLCSKAADVGLTRIGLELKAVIDQLREQIQNVE
ncbi:YicC/YloC family endoribonuclease [Parvibaculum sp.]|uniref:YicC/YloC family endoribonuclease n=1 Tax=Parvibaculum sp. TaxID=2024848 RepID=UPI002BEFA1E9|nr:YicC/YloC family endoribonuclease [Parvibaculum sp.]HUD50814.1 YicC/YloC family endoribonuclease [Parvibaculum sp.]